MSPALKGLIRKRDAAAAAVRRAEAAQQKARRAVDAARRRAVRADEKYWAAQRDIEAQAGQENLCRYCLAELGEPAPGDLLGACGPCSEVPF